jgi:uroporphyrinogen-III synthase
VGAEALRAVSPQTCLASIGPETTRTLREYTDAEIVEASEYTIPGLATLLTERLSR